MKRLICAFIAGLNLLSICETAYSRECGYIFFRRPGSAVGLAVKEHVTVDGRYVGTVPNKSCYYLAVTPGKHDVRAYGSLTSWDENIKNSTADFMQQTITVKAGESVFLRLHVANYEFSLEDGTHSDYNNAIKLQPGLQALQAELPSGKNANALLNVVSVKPAADRASAWSCPQCFHAGNTGVFCAECGARKPQTANQTGDDYNNTAERPSNNDRKQDVPIAVKRDYSNLKLNDYVPSVDDAGKWGYKQFGTWVIEPRFDDAGVFEDGLAPVKLGGKWGFINREGKCEIPYKYEFASSFNYGLARVVLYEKYGFIDKTGKTIIPLKYTYASDFTDGLAVVKYDGKSGYIDKSDQWFDTKQEMLNSFTAFARHYIESDINAWQRKGKYEKLAQWQRRVTDANRKARIDSLMLKAKEAFITSESRKVIQDQEIVDYDSETEVFLVHDKRFGNLLVPVPINEAEQFEEYFDDIQRKDTYDVNGDNLCLSKADFLLPGGKRYRYSNTATLAFSAMDIDYNFEAVDFSEDKTTVALTGKQEIAAKNIRVGLSDVDLKIPETNINNSNTFALIISNENYKFVSSVPYANHDGKVFEEYCLKTLGLPKDHIHRAEDATYGMIMGELDWITNIARVYNGGARIMVYYAGHGIPDESTKNAYILPVDGTGSNTSTAIKLSSVYSRLNEYNTESTIVFLDACFSGAQRNGQMLASARGVAIKPREERPEGKMIVFSAASGDETAYPYAEKGHGLFSYYLLKKLQDSRGDASLGELADYLQEQVSRQSIIQNAKSQTPTVVPSAEMTNNWKSLKLK